jgi:hypothetical protein
MDPLENWTVRERIAFCEGLTAHGKNVRADWCVRWDRR